MQHASLLPAVAAQKRVKVLVPFPLAQAYDYAVPEGMAVAPGDYVQVPLGKKETPGVVWSMDGDGALDAKKIKYILRKYDCPPMTAIQRDFSGKVADWTMAAPGAVLKMCLPAQDALEPPHMTPAYILAGQPPGKLAPARKKIAALLQDETPRTAKDLADETGCGTSVVRAMEKAGLLRAIATPPGFPGMIEKPPACEITLSPEQAAAATALSDIVAKEEFAAVLLDGVTGSGKTEVYFEAIATALERGKQVLVLLPEISLCAPFAARCEARFGVRPALWHSEIPPAQKRAAWRGVAEGKTKIIAGARSALFLPYRDLGLIVVDEEHDASYKQEEGVTYNARDMAVLRARLGGIAVALVSATPSLETMANARRGKYALLHLPERHAGAQLPAATVIDLKTDPPPRQRFISPPLRAALEQTFAAGEQSLLFLNRRGYAPLTLCRACGYRFQCPSCTAWLVEHKRHGRLQCHHCGFSRAPPPACPQCAEQDSFAACGPGVERIEEEAREILPDARTLILASDIVTSAKALDAAIAAISAGEVDVIIGTQIIAKGHHFPDLTLVGVVDADLGLSGGDLRAGERTFQLLHQVAGRAGRGEKPGRVLLQTYMPRQAVIKTLAAHDRDGFLAAEAREREAAGMPPFGRLAALVISGPDEAALDRFCRAIAQAAPRYDDIRVLGPAPAPLAWLRGRHRRRFLIKAPRGVSLQKYLAAWLDPVKTPSAIRLRIDIDPQSFF